MDDIFAITLTSMHQDMSRLDRVALNLANATTPGYKREVVAMRPFAEVLESTAADAAGSDPARMSATMQVRLDVRPGTLKMTSEPLDVALTGEGFLEVRTEDGLAYTRQGDLHLDGKGRLVTAQGFPVMGTNGDIYLTTQTPHIDIHGSITEPDATSGPSALAPGQPVAQIKVVRFDNAQEMQRLGNGLMEPGSGMTVAGGSESLLRQGALENANVSSMHEMVQLIQASRHFESMQKVTQGYDEMLGNAIRKLGEM